MCSTRTATASRWHWPGNFPVEPALPPLRGRVFSAAGGYQCPSAGVSGYDPKPSDVASAPVAACPNKPTRRSPDASLADALD